MRLTTLRTLLLVLALVAQTIAGGAGLARAASISSGETLSAPCHSLRAAEKPASGDNAQHRHNCHCCLLCGEPPPAWVAYSDFHVVALDEYALIDAPKEAAISRFEHSSWAHSARAPPVARV